MRVVVTGGTGLIGRALVRRLRADGHEPMVLTRSQGPAGRPGSGAVVWPAGGEDRTDGGWQREIANCDAVVHLAGASIGGGRWTPRVRTEILRSRERGTRQLVEALGQGGRPRTLVSASAVGYYGDGGDDALTEEAPAGRDFAAEVCRVWEAEAVRAERSGLRVVRARLGIVLAAEGGALGPMLGPFRLMLGGPVGSGRQWISWIHLDDAVAALSFLLQRREATGAFNLTAPRPVQSREFARAIGQALGSPSWLSAPAPILRLVFGEMADVLLLSGQRALPQRLLELGFEFRHPDVSSALRDLLRAH